MRWLKDSSATGIRESRQPNRRVQDGWKRPFLCPRCESRLNGWETPFSSKIFVPFHERAPSERAQTLFYREWCLPFCVSISWRVLKACVEDGNLPYLTKAQLQMIDVALKTWREYLLGQRPNPGNHPQYVFPFGTLASAPADQMSPYQNRYFLRTVQIDVLADDHSLLVYSKLGRLAVIGFVQPPSRHWRGWKVRLRKGSFPVQAFGMPYAMLRYLKAAADSYGRQYEQMSSRQQELARSGAQKAEEERADAFIAFEADVRMFGVATQRVT